MRIREWGDEPREPEPGDLVEVVSGPFGGLAGHVRAVEEDDVVVDVMVFGRVTPTRVPRSVVKAL